MIKPLKNTFFCLFLGIFFANSLLAQKVDYKKPAVDKETKLLYIPFEIKEQTKYHNLYNIELFYSQDKGKSYLGPLKQVSGDVGKGISPGEKVIIWNYLEEDTIFHGQDVKFKLKVTARLDPRYLPGPKSALYSVLMPGLGQPKVKPPSKFWWLHSVGVYSLIGSGIYMRIKSKQTRDTYLQSNTINEAQSLFDKSNRQRKISGGLFVAAGAWWLGDIVWVYLRGKKNQKNAKGMEPLPDIPEKKPELGLHVEPFRNHTLWGLKLKF